MPLNLIFFSFLISFKKALNYPKRSKILENATWDILKTLSLELKGDKSTINKYMPLWLSTQNRLCLEKAARPVF
jgi:hypothetical protein